jgi:hypothetical protein
MACEDAPAFDRVLVTVIFVTSETTVTMLIKQIYKSTTTIKTKTYVGQRSIKIWPIKGL